MIIQGNEGQILEIQKNYTQKSSLLLTILLFAGCSTVLQIGPPAPAKIDIIAGDNSIQTIYPLPDLTSLQPHGMLGALTRPHNFDAYRESSWDRTGDNLDALSVAPGETVKLCELEGPGVVNHIWITASGEDFYARKIILRAYWDGAKEPSIEAPLGDFFAVGHGADRDVNSLPVYVIGNGKSRNCFWPMPFFKCARFEIESQCVETIRAFYFHIDYKRVPNLPKDSLYFHARYRQEWPCPPIDLHQKNVDGQGNYLLLDTQGRGNYAGCTLSIVNNKPGWWGEGDDFIWVDGETEPRFRGTGSEEYFGDAWGLHEGGGLFCGCTLCDGYETGGRSTAYRFHIPDLIPFQESIRVSIEHGHANDRSDNFSSVAYWYQDSPFKNKNGVFAIPPVTERLSGEALALHETAVATLRVLKLLSEGKTIRAVTERNAVLHKYPGAANAGFLMYLEAVNFESSGQNEAALKRFKEIAERWPDSSTGQLAQAAVWRLSEKNHASISITCDDVYTVYLDGQEIGTDSLWTNLESYKVQLSPGKHVLAVKAKNVLGKSGLALAFQATGLQILTDDTWKLTRNAPANWATLECDDSKWDSATIYAPGHETPCGEQKLMDLIGIPAEAGWIWAKGDEIINDIVYFRKTFAYAP